MAEQITVRMQRKGNNELMLFIPSINYSPKVNEKLHAILERNGWQYKGGLGYSSKRRAAKVLYTRAKNAPKK